MKIRIISRDFALGEAIPTDLPKDVSVECVDVLSIPLEHHIFVSPANSLGFMDGGIDRVYRDSMFMGCETVVKSLIRDLGHVTDLGRPYLRVGSACWQWGEGQSALISAPTMFLPHDVSSTRNAYWAMIASLLAADKITSLNPGLSTLVVPTLCCGWGRMPVDKSLSQTFEAIRDWREGRVPEEVEDRGVHYVLLPSRDAEQPSNFDNREIGVPFGLRPGRL